jgi:ribose transport system substrate-binding protein
VKRLNFRRALLVAGVAAGVFVMASSSATPSNLVYVNAEIAKFKKIPAFTFKAPAFKARAGKGKTIFTIPIASYIPYITQTDQRMEKVAKKYGYKWIEFANQGQPSEWATGVQQAIQQKVDLIVLQGAPPPQLLVPQLAAAKAAGIPVLLTHIIDPSEPVPAGVTLAVPAPFKKAARLEADWTIKKTKGKANVLIITSNEVLPTTGIKKALANEYRKRCGSTCTYKFVNVPVSDWATKIGTEVQSALQADPTINYIIPIYDSMAGFVLPAVKTAGKEKTVHVATYNGTPFVMDLLRAGDVVNMEVGEDLDWLGHANMDAAMRILTNQPLPKSKLLDEQTPVRVFDATNVAEAGTPAVIDKGYGNAYKVGYAKLWNKK